MTKNIPEIISITSTNINEWANTINSREILPVLLRKLIHSTISEIEYIDFPGYDNSQQPGADGVLKVNGIKMDGFQKVSHIGNLELIKILRKKLITILKIRVR